MTAVAPRSLLLARMHVAEANLLRAERALATEDLSDDVRAKVDARFSALLNRLRRRLDAYGEQARRSPDLAPTWSQFVSLEREAAAVLDECRSFIEGGLARSAGLDDGVCELADTLLAELEERADVAWRRMTILGDEDSFANTAGIIRLRFPEFTVWHLPVVAHEFGHFVAEQAAGGGAEFRIGDRIAEQSRSGPFEAPKMRLHLGEHFADLFAVYSLGPAYAYTTTVLRFDPRRRDGDTHPADTKRVHFMLHGLELMGDGRYAGVADNLRKLWGQAGEAADETVALDERTSVQLDAWARDQLFELEDKLPPSVEYATWSKALRLAKAMRGGTVDGSAADATMRDVLNAAWRARVQTWQASGEVDAGLERRALELARATIATTTGVPG